MRLHDDKELFAELVAMVSDYYRIDAVLIEKDYFVTLLLRKLVSEVPDIIFKGGTSLSKCYKLIDRFSEDIDLTMDDAYQTQGYKKKMKEAIVAACAALEFEIKNFEEIKSRRDYNCYRIEYPMQRQSAYVKPLLLVETTYITKSYPTEVRSAASIIYDCLNERKNYEAIERYELTPFSIKVQALERTFVDKVFALCDYAVDNRIERNSRHIYDLSRLISKVCIDDNLKDLISDVRADRKTNALCYSAQDDFDVPGTLANIIKKDVYKHDYESVTRAMLYKDLPYNDAIKTLEVIIESEIFKK